jgi:hypothetical protein
MSRCQQCNTDLPDGARFCGICGSAQLPAVSVSNTTAPGTLEVDVATRESATTIPDTPPASPIITLNPNRTIHPGTKQTAIPEGAGSDHLRSTSLDPLQENPEGEEITPSGELEKSREMIPVTPEPSADANVFGPSNIPETPEPELMGPSDSGPARGSESIGQTLQPATPLPEVANILEPQQEADELKNISQPQFRGPKSAILPGTIGTSASSAPPVPVEGAVQFKSKIWPRTPEGIVQTGTSDRAHQEQADTSNRANQPGTPISIPGQAPGLIRPAGFPPSSVPPVNPRSPIPGGTSLPTPSGPGSANPGNTPVSPLMGTPPAQTTSDLQQRFAPAYTVVHGNTHHPQQPVQAGSQQYGATGSPGSSRQRSSAGGYPAAQTTSSVANMQSARAEIFAEPDSGLNRLESTSRAAELWRQSWLDRQRAEAGPAENVSRGQAAVPMPLMAMQHSLARMRAIIIANKEEEGSSSNTGFWITILLLICLIGGLGAYIIYSFVPGSPFGSTQNVQPSGAVQPSLIVLGSQAGAIVTGQVLHVHGQHFGANDTITFLLDTTQPIVDKSGQNISVQSNGQGTFDVTIPVSNNWSAGNHVIQAVDAHANLFAYLTIEVSPAGTPVKTSSDLALLLNGHPLQQLSLNAVVGQDNPSQRFTLSNTSGAPLSWSAVAIANNNLSWLIIDDNHNSGTLNISGTDSIGITANITGLVSSKKPYTGQILFTINNREQLTLPVQLMVNDAPSEVVFTPDPIIAQLGPGGTCVTGQNGASLTLINLGEQVISWKLGLDGNTLSHIQFSSVSGMLAPSDQPSSTQVITLTCTGVQAGGSYTITLYANGAQWTDQIFIQQ